MICRLCETNKDLRNSHILPEFLYNQLYDSKHRMAGITEKASRKWEFLQKGLREKLLCEDCEQFLNTNYEQPFNKFWFGEKVLPNHFDSNHITIKEIDYLSFKLFHISILFRASVSTLPNFSLVNLGLHEQECRKMLLSKNAGPPDKYPIFACAVVDKNYSIIQGVMTPPIEYEYEKKYRSYGIVFGGCVWWYILSTHGCVSVLPFSLNNSGALTIIPKRLNEIAAIQDASRILRDASPNSEVK
jgi:hypothetical protein